MLGRTSLASPRSKLATVIWQPDNFVLLLHLKAVSSSKWMSLFQICFQQIFCRCSPACFAQTEWPSNRPVFAPPSLEMVSTWATWASTEEHLDLPCCLAIPLLPGWVGAGCHTTWTTNIRSFYLRFLFLVRNQFNSDSSLCEIPSVILQWMTLLP